MSALARQFAEILFFDSHYELHRAKLLGGLVAIRKRGGSGLSRCADLCGLNAWNFRRQCTHFWNRSDLPVAGRMRSVSILAISG